MTKWTRKSGIVAGLALGAFLSPACSGSRQADTPTTGRAATDSAAHAAPAPAAPTRVAVVGNLQGPESARYDADLDCWFVSNVNGQPGAKDNNGYIARVTPDGRVDSLKFIAGGRNGVTLNAPKGLVIVGDTIWVADLDALRAFNKRTGAPIATVNLAGKAKFLNDGVVGPDGLYFTDSGMDPAMKHVGPDRIFRVGPDRKATIALESEGLHSPNGITWDSAGGRFIVVPILDTTLFAWKPGTQTLEAIGHGRGGEDGVEMLSGGAVLFTSWGDSSLSVFQNGRLTHLVGGLPSPADIGVDRGRGRVAIPLLMEGRMELWAVPMVSASARTASLGSGLSELHGEWVYIKRGADSIHAYVAYPERKTKAPAVIVIHEIFGLTKWEPTVVDRIAKMGYVAIVPDLLSTRFGGSPADADSGRKLVGDLAPDDITADLNATYAYLGGLPAVDGDRIGTIGFCWGGGQSFRYAANNPKLRAAVVCYGPAPDTAAMQRIKAPILGVYGEDDARITAALPTVVAAMKADGKNFVYDVYPGTGHGFLKPGRKGSDGPQPERAWTRIQQFLRARLGQ